MGRKKKESGCVNLLSYIFLLVIILYFFKRFPSNTLAFIGIAILILFILNFLIFIIEKIYTVTKEKYQKYKNQKLISYINKKTNQAKALAKIINTTVDKKEFYLSLYKLTRISHKLMQCKNVTKFSSSYFHEPYQIRLITDNKWKTIVSFNERVKKRKSGESISNDINSNIQEVLINKDEENKNNSIKSFKTLTEKQQGESFMKWIQERRAEESISNDINSNIQEVLINKDEENKNSSIESSKVLTEKQRTDISLSNSISPDTQIISTDPKKDDFYPSYKQIDYTVESDYCDEYFLKAGKLAIEKNGITIGMIQRVFRIGFNHASRIIDQLYEYGIIEEYAVTQPTPVLMNMEEYEIFVKNFNNGIAKKTIKEEKKPVDPIVERVQLYNNKFDYMEGHDFEYFCAELLKKNGFNDVLVTSGSRDQGIDIIAHKDGVKYGIQCKCYSSDIGNKAVQEAFSGAKFYDCHVPIVLTNRYFTSSAVELSQKTNVLLWGRDTLEKMIEEG